MSNPNPSDPNAGGGPQLPAGALRGKLLVATPTLVDPNFARTVVLILEHNEEGCLGVVVNRPSETPLQQVLPAWDLLAAPPPVVYVGGPVSPDAAICLGVLAADGSADAPSAPPGWTPLYGPLGAIDLDADPTELLVLLGGLRVFAGYAGWGASQLEAEIALGSWYVVDADPHDAFAPAADELWSAVLRRQGGALAIVATCPPDPSMN